MKRALKKREKVVLNNTPNSDSVPVEPVNETNHKTNRRAGTQAAMIGLAISMGATSLLVTRQSDQAQAAAPVGSQKAVSTTPAASDTEIKLVATKLESQAVSSASVPENPVIVVEPTAVSQVPGLEAKWPVAKKMAAQISTSEADSNAIYSQTQSELKQKLLQSKLPTAKQPSEKDQQLSQNQDFSNSQFPVIVETANTVSDDVNSQLKAQQKLAINRLQEKSNRLRNSLAELRSEESNDSLANTVESPKPTTVARQNLPVELESSIEEKETKLVSKLKQEKQVKNPEQKVVTSTPAIPTVVAKSVTTTYEVKPGDTLAEIASNYGTSISELVKANNLNDPNQLQISQKLIIPFARTEAISINQSTVAINPTIVEPSKKVTVASSPLMPPDLDANLPLASESRVVSKNSTVAIPVPVAKEKPVQVNPPTTSSSISIPVPVAENNQQQTSKTDFTVPAANIGSSDTSLIESIKQKPAPQKIAKVQGNERIRSLQAEIDRLREKYRSQQSSVTVQTATETENTATPIVVEKVENSTTAAVNNQENPVAIPVPKPILPSDSKQPVKQPSLHAARLNDEPINPQFLSNQNRSGNFTPGSSGIKLTVPPVGVRLRDSLGKLRGTKVSPALPPLAAVDMHLPKVVDQPTKFPPATAKTYIWPAKGVLTSGYGWRWGRMHRGIDIANSTGTPIYASAAGVVQRAGWNRGGYGKLVEIRHPDGSMTRYAHNSRILVQVGQRVEQGQTIAAMGSTGFSTGPHSHFELHKAGKGAINPIALLPSKARI